VDIGSVETRLRNQLEAQTRQLDQLPRTEIAKTRIALGKLSKDFERVKATVVLMISEAGMIKVEATDATSGGKGGAADGTVFKMGSQSNGTPKGGNGGMQFQNQMQGQDVDDLIAEERGEYVCVCVCVCMRGGGDYVPCLLRVSHLPSSNLDHVPPCPPPFLTLTHSLTHSQSVTS